MPFPARGCARTLFVGALLASGCGGGGSGGGGASVALTGHLASRDGSTTSLAGVSVSLGETGAAVVTGSDGSFHFQIPAGGTAHLTFTDPGTSAPPDPSGGCGDPWGPTGPDPTADPVGYEGDQVVLDDLTGTESVDIEVEIEGGVVSALRSTRSMTGTATADDGLGSLTCVDGSGAEGVIKLHGDPTIGFAVEIVAGGFPAGAPGEIVIDHGTGTVDTSALGLGVDACGGVYFIGLWGFDPVDPANTPNPAGWHVTVRAVSGGPDVLVGTIPAAGAN